MIQHVHGVICGKRYETESAILEAKLPTCNIRVRLSPTKIMNKITMDRYLSGHYRLVKYVQYKKCVYLRKQLY